MRSSIKRDKLKKMKNITSQKIFILELMNLYKLDWINKVIELRVIYFLYGDQEIINNLDILN